MKNKFIKSTLILIIGGFITKMLGMIIRIILSRTLSTTGMGIYSMILPTFTLLSSIAMLGLPTALNVLIAEDKRNNKNLIISSIIISITLDILIILFLFFTHTLLANYLLNEPRTSLGLLCIGLILPFISVSNILRSYFFGKQRMLPHVITNIIEDIIKLILILLGLPFALMNGINVAIAYIFLTSIVCELSSIIIFIFLLPKNLKIEKKDIKLNFNNIKALLKIALPTTGSRLIGSIGYFLEPIIITYTLLKVGYTQDFIVNEYGIINGYVMQIVLIPSFFTLAISQALIPIVSKSFANKKYDYTKKKIKQAIFFSLLIGIPATICFLLFPDIILKFLYNTNKGVNYLKILAPICLLHYIQSPLSSSLQAMNKASVAMKGTFYGMIIRTILLFLASLLKIGMHSLIIATSANIIFVTLYQYINVKKELSKNL